MMNTTAPAASAANRLQNNGCWEFPRTPGVYDYHEVVVVLSPGGAVSCSSMADEPRHDQPWTHRPRQKAVKRTRMARSRKAQRRGWDSHGERDQKPPLLFCNPDKEEQRMLALQVLEACEERERDEFVRRKLGLPYGSSVEDWLFNQSDGTNTGEEIDVSDMSLSEVLYLVPYLNDAELRKLACGLSFEQISSLEIQAMAKNLAQIPSPEGEEPEEEWEE